MESKERLELMDEVKKRVEVTYKEAGEALERNGFDVLETVLELEMKKVVHGVDVKQRFKPRHAVTFHRKGKDLVTLPAAAVLGGALLLGMKKPALLIVAVGAAAALGTDIRFLKDGEEKFSLKESFLMKTRLSASGIADMKESVMETLDDRFHDIKDRREMGIFRDGQEHGGVKHFTIRL